MEYLVACMYVLLGLFGGYGHYFKKRYVDSTTEQNLIEYLKGDWTSTKKAIFAIVTSEIALSISSGGTLPGLGAIIGAITLGYSSDSLVNKASDSPKINKE